MKPSKKIAAGLAAATALAGLATLTVSTEASAYGPSTHTLGGRLYFGDAGVGASASNYTDTFSLTVSPSTPSIGSTVTVTMSGTTGPIVGPASIALGGQDIRVNVVLTEFGQSPVSLELSSQNATAMGVIPIGTTDTPPVVEDPGPPATYYSSIGGSYPVATVLGGSNSGMGAWEADATYTATTPGLVSIAFQRLKFNARASGAANVDVYFTDGNTCNHPTVTTANNADCASAAPNGFTGQHGGNSTNGVDPKNAPVTSPDIIEAAIWSSDPDFDITGNASNQNAAAYARAGDTFPVAVVGFSGATADIQRCAASSTVTTCDSGASLGTVTLTSGDYTGASPAINAVAAGGTTAKLCAISGATTRCSTTINLLSNPIVRVNGASTAQTIPVGTSITISGTNFDPSKALTACGLYSGSGMSAVTYETCPGPVTVAADGTFTSTYPVTIASVGATNGFASQFHVAGPPPANLLLGFVPVTVSANVCTAADGGPAGYEAPTSDDTCNVSQNLSVTITANAAGLRLGQSDNATNFGTFATQAGDHAHSAALDTTTVQDARGGNVGWTSSAFVANDFSDGAGHTITKDRLAIQVTCASTTNAGPLAPPATVAAPLAGQTLSGTTGAPVAFAPGAGSVSSTGVVTNGIPLCDVGNTATGNGGTWTQSVNATLTIPAYQAAGTYSTLLTVVLTSR